MNDCDPCIANKIANYKQHTLVWHADNVKVSRVNSEVNDSFAQFVKDKCEDTGKVKAILGKVYDYLGAKLHFAKQ